MEKLEHDNLIHKNKIIAGRFLPAIISFLILVFFDQLTKYFITHNMALYESIPVIQDIFEIHYIQNPGTAWGLLADKQLLFAVSTVITFVFGGIAYIRLTKLSKYRDIRILIVVILAGGMGNFIDRIRYQYVIDFLYFKLINFPVFNVADCYVTIGFGLLLLLVFFKYKDDDFEELFGEKR